jgi:hypothetical protein
MFPACGATLGNWRDSGTLRVAAQRYLGTSEAVARVPWFVTRDRPKGDGQE